MRTLRFGPSPPGEFCQFDMIAMLGGLLRDHPEWHCPPSEECKNARRMKTSRRSSSEEAEMACMNSQLLKESMLRLGLRSATTRQNA